MGTLLILLFVAALVVGLLRTFEFAQTAGGDRTWKIHATRGVPFFALAVFFGFIAMSFTTVTAGTIGVVLRFGKPVRQLTPGPHFILPFADSVTPVSVQTSIVKPSEDAASHDLQGVHTEVTLAYHVDPAYATDVLVSLNDDAETRVIDPAILEAIKSVMAQYDVQDLISERPLVRDAIETFVRNRLAPYHIVAETTSITDFRFSADFENAIEAKVTAEQLAEKAKNDLTRIQIQAQQQVAQAQGEADALKLQKEQITPELLQLRTIEMMKDRWDGHLPSTLVEGSGGALPMMDVLAEARSKEK
jgi:regulator of protease activity HflC (stomatin/prohibitin superfamily)